MKRHRGYFIIAGCILIIFIVYNARILIKRNNINKEYPNLLISDSLDAVISSKFFDDDFKYTPSVLIFTTSYGKKISILAEINPNYGDEAVGINDVSEVGDRIYKRANNDTILVYKSVPKDINVYCFILSKH